MTARIEGVEYTLSLQGIGPVYVKRIEYTETFNEPYRLEVECLIPTLRDQPVQQVCEQLVGVDGTLKIERTLQSKVTEQIHGLVIGAERASSRFELQEQRAAGDVGRPEEGMDDSFVVHLAPAFEMLRLHTWGQGSWHERTYPEVLVKVLGEALGAYGRQVTDKTTQTTKIDHIVRPPEESMLAFAQRLMRAGGITSFFAHDGGTETLVLADTNDAFVEGTQYQPRNQPFRVDYTQRHNLSENVQSLGGSATAEPKKVEFVSFDRVGTPPVPIEGTTDGAGPGEAIERNWGALRPTEIGDADKQHEDAATLVTDRAATVRNTVTARTTILGMLAGRTYEIELKVGDVRTYVVKSVKAEGIGAEYGTREDYANEVELVPLTTESGGPVEVQGSSEPDVPPRTMPGLTLAEIVAIENPPVEVDRMLRCRLKFLWDQQEGESPTTWVSVLQNMAGLFGGSQWIPREGDRVVVAFHEGRSDRGVILGALYDEELKPPYMGPPDRSSVLPQSAMWLGWNHSSIEPGKRPKEQSKLDRHTMLCMDVTADQELFYFAAPKDWRRDVGNDAEANIVRHQTVDIGGDREQKVAGQESESVGKDYAQNVDGSRSIEVGGSDEHDVGGTSKVSVSGKRTEKFGGYSQTVTGSMSSTVLGGSRTDRVVGGKWQQTSAVALSFAAPIITISAAFVGFGGGGSGKAAGAELSLKTKAKLEGPQGATIKGGTSTVSAELRGVSSHGRSVQARDAAGGRTNLSDGSYVVDAPRGVTLRCGSTELRLTPDGLYLDGRRVSISATDTEIETTRLDINGDTPGSQGDA